MKNFQKIQIQIQIAPIHTHTSPDCFYMFFRDAHPWCLLCVQTDKGPASISTLLLKLLVDLFRILACEPVNYHCNGREYKTWAGLLLMIFIKDQMDEDGSQAQTDTQWVFLFPALLLSEPIRRALQMQSRWCTSFAPLKRGHRSQLIIWGRFSVQRKRQQRYGQASTGNGPQRIQ